MIPRTSLLPYPGLVEAARQLPSSGQLALSENRLIYLSIDDRYIHELFPLLSSSSIKKPNYFQGKSIGAHITVFYPEENIQIAQTDLGVAHRFYVRDLVSAEIKNKLFIILLVNAPSLLQLRIRYRCPALLNFKGHLVDFHITIGMSSPK